MRKQYLNVLRVVCSICVVFLHSNEGFWVFSYEPYWVRSTIVTMCCFFAVPCFFMISGTLLIDYSDRYTTKEFVIKRIKKTMLPYIAWSLIVVAYLIYYQALDLNSLSLSSLLRMIINNEVLPIYWFFPMIMTVYLICPVLSVIPEEKRKGVFRYIIIAIFFLNVLIPFAVSIFQLGAFSIQFPIKTECIYLILGYYIDRYLLGEKRKIIYSLGVFGGGGLAYRYDISVV